MASTLSRFAIVAALCVVATTYGPGAAAALTVDQVFNQREVYGPSSFGGPGADLIVFGAIDVLPNGDGGTTGTFEQLNTSTNALVQGAMQFTPFSQFPNAFGAPTTPYQPGLSGSWKLTFTNGADKVEVLTPSIGTAPAPAAPIGLSISGIGTTTPTLNWGYPAGSTATSSSITIYDRERANPDIIHVAFFSNAVTNYTVPATLSSGKALEFGHQYTFSVELNDNRSDGSYRARGFSFVDFVLRAGGPAANLYLPQTVPDEAFPAGGYYQFSGVPVQANVTVNVDPDVAIGYEFDIGAGDPLFRTVVLPVGIGDGKYDIYLLNHGSWVLFAANVLGGEVVSFGDGVSAFEVLGIEPSANIDPSNPTAFVTALTFASDGTFNGRMIPLVTQVPEPAAWMLLLAGVGIVGFAARRRESSRCSP